MSGMLMPDTGQQRRSACWNGKAGLPPEADIVGPRAQVRFVPEATLQARLEAEVGYMGPLPPYRSSPCRMFPGTLPY